MRELGDTFDELELVEKPEKKKKPSWKFTIYLLFVYIEQMHSTSTSSIDPNVYSTASDVSTTTNSDIRLQHIKTSTIACDSTSKSARRPQKQIFTESHAEPSPAFTSLISSTDEASNIDMTVVHENLFLYSIPFSIFSLVI